MDGVIGFFGFLAFCALSSGVVGLVAVIFLRRQVRELEEKVQRLSSSVRELQREVAQPTEAPAPLPVRPEAQAPPAISIPAPPAKAVAPQEPPAAPPAPVAPLPATAFRESAREDSLESLENIVGTRWLNWIGALVVLVGIAFLLKYLYDRGWIGPAGRVGIGLAFGVGLLWLGEMRLRRVHDLLSQAVSASGCGALFLTTFLAFKFYDFSGRVPTFLLLCWFAGFTVVLAVVRNGRILAYLGLLGAYLTPYLLSTGQDQAEALFGYLAVLSLAAAFVCAARGWAGIPALSLGLTCIYYVGWHSRFYAPERLPVAVAGAGGLILFLGAVALARALWNRAAARTEECLVIILSALVGIYYLWDLLAHKRPALLGFALCIIACAGLGALLGARRRRAAEALLETTLLGIGAGSLLLVIPACLDSSGAMLAWALAAVLLADIGSRSRRWVLEAAAGVSLLAAPVVGLAEPVRHSGAFHPVFNRVFVAWFGAVLAWFVAGARYLRSYWDDADRRRLGIVIQIASCFMLIAVLSYEVVAWFAGQMGLPGADRALLGDRRTVYLCLLWSLYPAIWFRRAKDLPRLWVLSLVYYAVMGLGLFVLLTDFHQREVLIFLNQVFLAALFFPAAVFYVSRRIDDGQGRRKTGLEIYGHLLLVLLLSVELYQGLFLPSSYDASRYWIRMALISAGWAVYATVVLTLGISRNLPAWRWLALSLLGVTLVKVFLVDMAEVRQIWRVLSFLILGALLMACSYAYARRERERKLEGNASEKKLEVPR